jgi:hypothetical protein
MGEMIEKALTAKRESKRIEFKQSFDVNSAEEWVEIIKDMVAMANSGGGVLVFGLDNHGNGTKADLESLRAMDPATITDRVSKYTRVQFTEFELVPTKKGPCPVVAIRVFEVETPIVFEKPGTCAIPGQKQKTAFSQGTVYFRHGAKSEPANNDDLRKHIERQREVDRKEFLKNVQQIAKAPARSSIAVLPPGVTETEEPGATPIRIVEDPNAPVYRKLNPDQTHPFRRKELTEEVRARLPKGVTFTPYDINVIRKVFDLDENDRFVYFPFYASPQYSQEFADWIVVRVREDRSFFQKARANRRT